MSYANWNFKDQHVDPTVFQERDQNFVSSESIIFCSAPAEYNSETFTATNIWPIGLVENASIIQNKQIQQLFEIGSRLSYMIPGRTMTQIGIARVFFNGPSLMKYLSLKTFRSSRDKESGFQFPGKPYLAEENPNVEQDLLPGITDSHFFINLASDLFNRPLGIVMLIHDSENDQYGGAYFENCYIQSHQMALAAAQTVIMENVSIRCTSVEPLTVADMNIIK